ncbi:hypothetical protein K470DRAFT_293964, partial [Piedraia hortae CBS 480.64]
MTGSSTRERIHRLLHKNDETSAIDHETTSNHAHKKSLREFLHLDPRASQSPTRVTDDAENLQPFKRSAVDHLPHSEDVADRNLDAEPSTASRFPKPGHGLPVTQASRVADNGKRHAPRSSLDKPLPSIPGGQAAPSPAVGQALPIVGGTPPRDATGPRQVSSDERIDRAPRVGQISEREGAGRQTDGSQRAFVRAAGRETLDNQNLSMPTVCKAGEANPLARDQVPSQPGGSTLGAMSRTGEGLNQGTGQDASCQQYVAPLKTMPRASERGKVATSQAPRYQQSAPALNTSAQNQFQQDSPTLKFAEPQPPAYEDSPTLKPASLAGPAPSIKRDMAAADTSSDMIPTHDTESYTLHERWAPAVTHHTIETQTHEILHEEITREIHTHDIYHRILPIIDIEVLPARHFVPSADGYVEISSDEVPGRAGEKAQWVIAETVSKMLPQSSGSSELIPRRFTARTFKGTEGDYREEMGEDGALRTEQWWVHPPTIEQGARRTGQTVPFYFGFPDPKMNGLGASLPDGKLIGVSPLLAKQRKERQEEVNRVAKERDPEENAPPQPPPHRIL